MTVVINHRSPGKVSITSPSSTVTVTDNVQELVNVKGGIRGEQGPQGEPGADAVVSITYTLPGLSYTSSGRARLYFSANCTITAVTASVGTPPTGSSILVDVNKNGTTIFTTQSNRPEITDGGHFSSEVPNITTLTNGDYLTVDIDQVGSITPGADLVVVVEYTR